MGYYFVHAVRKHWRIAFDVMDQSDSAEREAFSNFDDECPPPHWPLLLALRDQSIIIDSITGERELSPHIFERTHSLSAHRVVTRFRLNDMGIRELVEGWSFTETGGGEGTEDGEWLGIEQVPTTVHVELLKAKRIPDPVS